MTYQTAYSANRPVNGPADSAQSGVDHAAGGSQHGSANMPPPRSAAKRHGSALLLAILFLIAVAFTFAMLSPDQLLRIVTPVFERAPSATIAVAPAPGLPTTAPSPAIPSPQPSASRPSTAAAVPPASAPGASGANSVANSEPQMLRAMLAEVSGRLGALEQRAAETRQSDLTDRLHVLEARLAALIEQPAVTPGMLADALAETRQAAQVAAQDAAQTTAQITAQTAASRAIQAALQEEMQKAQAAQKDVAPAIAELEKRMAALEKMAPAVVSIADIDKRVMGLEKMAPAVVAIGDLERRLAGLEKAAVTAQALADFDRRLAGVENAAGPLAAMSQHALQGESMALGLLNLRLALDRGSPYAEVLSALRGAAVNDAVLTAEVDRLALTAASGVPTLAVLRQRLLALPAAETAKPPTAAQSAAQPPSSETPAQERGFWADIGQRLASIVTIRRLDANASSPGQSAADARMGAIERAAARLISDDLPGAVAMFEGDVMGRDRVAGQQSALDDWLRDARERLAAESSFATLSRRSLALYSARADRPMPASPARSPTIVPPPAAPQAAPQESPSAPGGDAPGDMRFGP